MSLRMIGAGMTAALLAIPPAIGIAAASKPSKLATAVLVDNGNARVGAVVELRSDTRQLRGGEVSYTRGVTGRIPTWKQHVHAATYAMTVDGATQPITGYLWAGPTRSHTTVTLQPRNATGPIAVLHAGRHPRLDIRSLPSGTHDVEIDTIGAGRSLLHVTSPCSKHQQRWASQVTVRFGDALGPATIRRPTKSSSDLCKLPPSVIQEP